MNGSVPTIRISAIGSDIDTAVANLREKLDEQLGVGGWYLCDCGECRPVWIDAKLSAGGTAATYEVTLIARGDRDSLTLLPREILDREQH